MVATRMKRRRISSKYAFMVMGICFMFPSHYFLNAKNNVGNEELLCQTIVVKNVQIYALQEQDIDELSVDLGLPSKTRWAKFNIGSTSDTKKGARYAWGETFSKSEFLKANYSFYTPKRTYTDEEGFTQTTKEGYKNIGTNISGTKYDVATEQWGTGWSMPTKEDWDELITYCIIEETKKNNAPGLKVTGPNGNWIFLVAEYGIKKSVTMAYKKEWLGKYWSGTLSPNGKPYCIHFEVDDSASKPIAYQRKVVNPQEGRYFVEIYDGYSIRPVYKNKK